MRRVASSAAACPGVGSSRTCITSFTGHILNGYELVYVTTLAPHAMRPDHAGRVHPTIETATARETVQCRRVGDVLAHFRQKKYATR